MINNRTDAWKTDVNLLNRNTIINQSARVFSFSYFLNIHWTPDMKSSEALTLAVMNAILAIARIIASLELTIEVKSSQFLF